MRRSRGITAALVVAALAGLVGGCAGKPTEYASPRTPSVTTVAAEVVIPDSAPGRATRWVVEQFAADSGPSAAEAAERFAPVFLEQIPASEVAGVFGQIRALGPFALTGYSEAAGNAQASVTGAGEQRFLISVSIDDAELIQGLWVQPAPELPEIDSLADASSAVQSAAEASSFLFAQVVGDGAGASCEPIEARDAEVLRPIGSIFKLYVLGAVVQAVADGALAWEDTLTLTDDLRSLPSGTLQDEPAGTQVTVQDAAEAMISISDNTATDMLIDAVGRDAVEAAVLRMGHSEPEVVTPFLTTREMFLLAFSSAALRGDWIEASGADPLSPDTAVSAKQREVVEALPGGEIVLDPELFARPAWPDGLDWFATADDLCAAHLALQDMATTTAGTPVRDILAINPGGVETTDGVDYVGFKGGSAPGEMAGSWYIEAGEQRYVLVVQVADAEAVPDGAWLASVAGHVVGLEVARR